MSTILVNDKVYGKIEITEPVLIELINSSPVQRLKNISQFGIPEMYFNFFKVKGYSRFEHSLGVMILLKKLGATPEEQVAGLLHDVSHLAFSHLADWLFSDGKIGKEDYHDSLKREFAEKTGLSEILKKHGYLYERILNEKNFQLLEKDIPNLCCDRIDYSLRQLKYWYKPKLIEPILNSLKTVNNEIIFTDKKTAISFAGNFLRLQTYFWGGFESTIRYNLFSEILNIAMDNSIIDQKDFYQDEISILEKVSNSKIIEIDKIFQLLKHKRIKKGIKAKGEKVYKKFRYIDPKVLWRSQVVELSVISPKFKKLIEKHRKINEKGFCV